MRNKVTRPSVVPPVNGEAYTKYFASSYDFLTNLTGWRRNLAKHALKDLSPCKMLDVGCGTGYLLRIALQQGFDAYGVDPSSGMLAKAKENNGIPESRLLQSNADELSFADQSFDLATASGSLEYVPNMEKAAREISRVVRKGGHIRIIVHARPVKKNLLTPFIYLFSQATGHLIHDIQHYFSPFSDLAGHKTIGRGGYLQLFDFIKK